jgi:hypothetical protein
LNSSVQSELTLLSRTFFFSSALLRIVWEGGSNYHPGNVAFRHLVGEAKFDFLNICRSKDEKEKIILLIIAGVQESGGRFIQRDEAMEPWTVLSDEDARKKVRAALRGKTIEDPPSDWEPSEEAYEDWPDAEFGLDDEHDPDGLDMVAGQVDPQDMIVDRGRTWKGPTLLIAHRNCMILTFT